MKPLNDYINEKLKLSDINKDKLYDGEWIDAKHLKIKDLKSGNIIQVKDDNTRYICVSIEVAKERFRLLSGKYNYDLIFVSDHGTYLGLDSYINTWPKNENIDTLDIVRVNRRIKYYKDYPALARDLNIITTF